MMVKEHYDKHLGNFYSWMTGDLQSKVQETIDLFRQYGIQANSNSTALDLGCGHGIQSIALANLGFQVTSVDFNAQLLVELNQNSDNLPIKTVNDDIGWFMTSFSEQVDIIICMGDTLTHLTSFESCEKLFDGISSHLKMGGLSIVSFRDLTHELTGTQRFIPVKSDETRILTCFLEYFEDHVMVHDLLHEKENGKLVQKISTYPKLRLSEDKVRAMILKSGMKVVKCEVVNRQVHILAEKT